MSNDPAKNGDTTSGNETHTERVEEFPIDSNALSGGSLSATKPVESSDNDAKATVQKSASPSAAQPMPTNAGVVSNAHTTDGKTQTLASDVGDTVKNTSDTSKPEVVANTKPVPSAEQELPPQSARDDEVLENASNSPAPVVSNQAAAPQPYIPPAPAKVDTRDEPPKIVGGGDGKLQASGIGAATSVQPETDRKELEKKAKALLGELDTMSKQQKKDDLPSSKPPSSKSPKDMDSVALKAIAGALVLVVALGGLVVATGVVQVPGIADLRRAATGEVDCSEPDANCCDGWAPPGGEPVCNTSLCQEFECIDGNWEATGQSCGGGSCEGGAAVCGDGVCNAGETCDNCFADCNAAGMCDGSVSNFDLYRSGTCILADNTTAEAVVVQTACFVCGGPANDSCNDVSADYLRSCGGGQVTVPAGETQFTVVCSPGDIAACENYQVDAFVDGDSDAIVGEHPTQGEACVESVPSPTPTTPPGVTPSATPVPSATPTAVPSSTPTPLPSGAPSPTPTQVPSSTPTPNPSLTPSPVPPTNTPVPNQPTATPTPVALPQSGSMTPTALMIMVGMVLLLIGVGGLLAF